jgi:hypothetical protein
MRIDLAGIPVVDAHCHPFPVDQVEVTAQQLRDALSEELTVPTPPANQTLLLARMLVRRLARLLGCEPTWEAVLAARNAAARAGILAYHELLFADAKIGMLLVDPGYPAAPHIPAEEFSRIVPCPVFAGYRIERFAPRGMVRGGGFGTFADFAEAFAATLDAEAAKPDTRFFKSVIAYYTGLAIRRVSDGQASAAWKEHESPGDPAEKALRDWMFWTTARKAQAHGLPFQLHTGHTSRARPWPEANPILLTPILNEPELAGLALVLVHGGYPYGTEAGYLACAYPNVALDLSLMVPWSSIGVARRIEQTLEIAPTAKVMYGSDGIHVPELFWIGAHNARRALGRVLERLVDEEVLGDDEAVEVGRDILHRNAERIYGVALGSAPAGAAPPRPNAPVG